MEIERINENTVKFYISYLDIEDRGFEREEIWYNRERSEQLFWEMMEEVNFKEDFTIEGPLWIQVQAMEKGLEVIVTKAQISQNGENIELPTDSDGAINIPVDKNIEKMLDDKADVLETLSSNFSLSDEEEMVEDIDTSIIVSFADFEDVIQLSHYINNQIEASEMEETLYHYNDKYYLYVEFPNDLEKLEIDDIISQVYEFANDDDITIHLLSEYGKKVIEKNVFSHIRSYFPA